MELSTQGGGGRCWQIFDKEKHRGLEIYTHKMDISASKLSRLAILQLLADLYHEKFVSWHVDHF